METILPPSKPVDANELSRIYAKEKGISETAAWAMIRQDWVPKSEVLNIVTEQLKGPQQQPSKVSDILAQRGENSLERLKLEYEMKKEAREDARLQLDREIQTKKLELEERRLQAKEDFDRMLLLMGNGKKPEEAMEMLKNQEKFYERFLDERTRHTEELGELKEEAEKKTKEIKSEMDARFEKFMKEYQNKPASDDFITKMKEYRKMQDEFLGMTFDTLEARGFPKIKLDEMRKATLDKTKEQEDSFTQLVDVGKTLYQKFLVPAAKKAQDQMDNAPSGLQLPGAPIQTPPDEAQIRAMTDRNAKIVEEKAQERARLTARADQLNIPYTSSISNDQLLEIILAVEKELMMREKELLLKERQGYESKAASLGVVFDNTMSNHQLFAMIEEREAALERERQERTRRQELEDEEERQRQEDEAIEAERLMQQQEAQKKEDIKPEERPPLEPSAPGQESQETIIESEIIEEQKEPGEEKKEKAEKPDRKAKKITTRRLFDIYKEGDENPTIELEATTHFRAVQAAAKTKNIFNVKNTPITVRSVDARNNEEKRFKISAEEYTSTLGKEITTIKVRQVG